VTGLALQAKNASKTAERVRKVVFMGDLM